jgi:hypothetical protein
VKYKALGKFQKPRSVIDEYSQSNGRGL